MKYKGGMYTDQMWVPVKVTIDFVGRLCGSVPANPNLVQRWLDSRKSPVKPAGSPSIEQLAGQVISSLPDLDEQKKQMQENVTLTFQQLHGKLGLRAATFRSHLKDCARQIQKQNGAGRHCLRSGLRRSAPR